MKELCGIPEKDAIKSSESGFELEVDGDGIPVKFLTVSEQLNTLLNFKEGEGEKEIVEFLKNPNNIKILGQKLRYVLHVVGPKALYKGSWWESIQRYETTLAFSDILQALLRLERPCVFPYRTAKEYLCCLQRSSRFPGSLQKTA